MRSVALWMVVVLGVPVGAARAEAPVLVYVNEFTVQDPKLASDAGALTSALCAALARDKRVDVLCAPDVRQLLSFAAASSMMGSTSPATENLERRAAATGRRRQDRLDAVDEHRASRRWLGPVLDVRLQRAGEARRAGRGQDPGPAGACPRGGPVARRRGPRAAGGRRLGGHDGAARSPRADVNADRTVVAVGAGRGDEGAVSHQ